MGWYAGGWGSSEGGWYSSGGSGGSGINQTALHASTTIGQGTNTGNTTGTLTTTVPSMIIVWTQSNSSGPSGTPTTTTGLVLTPLASFLDHVQAWYAYDPTGAISGTFTSSFAASQFNTIHAFAVSGVKASGAFDGSAVQAAGPATITTTYNWDFVFSLCADNSSSPTHGTGWNTMPNTGVNFTLAQYQQPTTTGSFTGNDGGSTVKGSWIAALKSI